MINGDKNELKSTLNSPYIQFFKTPVIFLILSEKNTYLII